MQLPRGHAETVCLRLQESRDGSPVTDIANGRAYPVYTGSAAQGLGLGKPTGPMTKWAKTTTMLIG